MPIFGGKIRVDAAIEWQCVGAKREDGWQTESEMHAREGKDKEWMCKRLVTIDTVVMCNAEAG